MTNLALPLFVVVGAAVLWLLHRVGLIRRGPPLWIASAVAGAAMVAVVATIVALGHGPGAPQARAAPARGGGRARRAGATSRTSAAPATTAATPHGGPRSPRRRASSTSTSSLFTASGRSFTTPTSRTTTWDRSTSPSSATTTSTSPCCAPRRRSFGELSSPEARDLLTNELVPSERAGAHQRPGARALQRRSAGTTSRATSPGSGSSLGAAVRRHPARSRLQPVADLVAHRRHARRSGAGWQPDRHPAADAARSAAAARGVRRDRPHLRPHPAALRADQLLPGVRRRLRLDRRLVPAPDLVRLPCSGAACALERRRDGIAGALLAVATALRIFPAVFLAGPVLARLWEAEGDAAPCRARWCASSAGSRSRWW